MSAIGRQVRGWNFDSQIKTPIGGIASKGFTPPASVLRARPNVRPAMSDAIALVLAGGRGSRLKELTAHRSKPSLYFGGKYRIVDFTLSNCVNSGLRRIAILTQYKSHSLLSHVQRGWGFLRGEINEFVELLPAQQQIDEESWYK